ANGDGRDDLIGNTSSFLEYSNGDGTFTQGPSVGYSATGDFGGTGCTGFMAASGQSPYVTYVFTQPCTSTPVASPSSSTTVSYTFVVGDFNDDGKTDFIAFPFGGGNGTLYLASGSGFVAQSFVVPSSWANYQIVTGDWNGDGKTDIALIAKTYGNPH